MCTFALCILMVWKWNGQSVSHCAYHIFRQHNLLSRADVHFGPSVCWTNLLRFVEVEKIMSFSSRISIETKTVLTNLQKKIIIPLFECICLFNVIVFHFRAHLTTPMVFSSRNHNFHNCCKQEAQIPVPFELHTKLKRWNRCSVRCAALYKTNKKEIENHLSVTWKKCQTFLFSRFRTFPKTFAPMKKKKTLSSRYIVTESILL